MKVEAIARTPPVTATPDTKIRDVARIMAEKKVGLVVIVEEAQPDVAVGVVGERDIVRAVASGVNLDEPVSTIMSKPVVTVEWDEPVWKVAEIMKQYNVRRVVVTKGGKLYGVVGMRDLVTEVLINIIRQLV